MLPLGPLLVLVSLWFVASFTRPASNMVDAHMLVVGRRPVSGLASKPLLCGSYVPLVFMVLYCTYAVRTHQVYTSIYPMYVQYCTWRARSFSSWTKKIQKTILEVDYSLFSCSESACNCAIVVFERKAGFLLRYLWVLVASLHRKYSGVFLPRWGSPLLGAGSNCKNVFSKDSSTSMMAAWFPQR